MANLLPGDSPPSRRSLPLSARKLLADEPGAPSDDVVHAHDPSNVLVAQAAAMKKDTDRVDACLNKFENLMEDVQGRLSRLEQAHQAGSTGGPAVPFCPPSSLFC